jgi:hypothetical protein
MMKIKEIEGERIFYEFGTFFFRNNFYKNLTEKMKEEIFEFYFKNFLNDFSSFFRNVADK